MRALCALTLLASAWPARAADPPPKLDRYGDPLPAGALMRLGTLRARAPITSFGIQKNGTIVTVGPHNEVRRWDLNRDKSSDPVTVSVPKPTDANYYPQVSPDGRTVAVYSGDMVYVWAEPTSKLIAEFDVPRLRAIRFSPDGSKLVATVGSGRDTKAAAHVCDITTGKAAKMDGGFREVDSADFSGDGKRLFAVADGGLVVWDTSNGKQLAKHTINGRITGTFAVNRAGDLVVLPVATRLKRSWQFLDAITGKERTGMNSPDPDSWATFAPDEKTLFVGGSVGVGRWDPVAGKELRFFEGVAVDGGAIQPDPARLSPDGKVLVAHNGHAILRWDATTGKPLVPEQGNGHASTVRALGVSPDGKFFATHSEDGRVCVWDANTGKEQFRRLLGFPSSQHVWFSPDAKFLYVGGPDWGEVTKLDATTGKIARTFETDSKAPLQARVSRLRLSADGKTLFGMSSPANDDETGRVTAWDTETGERIKSVSVPSVQCFRAELSPNGTHIARAVFGGVVALDDLKTDLLDGVKMPGTSLFAGKFSDDGKWLVNVLNSAGDEPVYTAVIVSTRNWRVAATVPVPEYGQVVISPDGKTLAFFGDDKLKFFDVATGKSVGEHRVTLPRWEKTRFGATLALRFTPDGTKLITGHADTTALVWPVPRPAK